MKPEVNEILTGVLGTVLTDIAPHLPEGYPQGSMTDDRAPEYFCCSGI